MFDFATDLARVRRGHRKAVDDALARLARWMAAHPDASPEDVIRSEAYGKVLDEFDAEIRDMHGALVEVMPAMLEDAVSGRSAR